MATSNNNDCGVYYFKQGSCSIILKKGDLLKETDINVFVIPTPELSEQNPDNFAIFKSIYSHADENKKREIKRLRSELKLLHPQVTWENDRIYILAVPPYLGNPNKAHELLGKTYTSCLRLAVQNNLRKIAFPTIGCGVIGFDTKTAARIVHSAFENFIQSADGKKMDEIRVVVYKDEVWKYFTTTFMDLNDSKQTKIKFVDILTRNSNPTEMPPKRDEKPAPQRDSHKKDTEHYEDDWEDDKRGNQRDPRLNPDSPEFCPKHKNPSRGLRRYLINNKNTELHILQGDILEEKVDAIVNATNESMIGRDGIDGAIHKAAGDELFEACKMHKQIRPGVRLPTGRSRILLSYKMSRTTHYIINTASPHYDAYPPKECKKYLISCYKTSLALANLYHLETISFPAISCGEHGYPMNEAAEVALTTVDQSANSLKTILFVLKDDKTYDTWVKIAEKLSFISMDDPGSVMPSTPKTPTTNTQKSTEQANAHDASKQSTSRKDIDEPASNDIATSVECTGDQPTTIPEKQGATGGVVTDSEPKVVQKKNDKSEKPKDGNEGKGATSNNPSKQKGAQQKNQKTQPQTPHNDTKRSIVSGNAKRGGKN